MKILFFSHYFPPEVNAPATRTFDHCARWARAGHDVTVVTCTPNCPDGVAYPGYRNRLRRQVEMVEGIRVVRVWSYLAANAGSFRRIVNYLSFMFSAIVASLRLPRPDVVMATSPQFFCGWAGAIAAWLRRRPFVLEIRDIWPESIEAVGAMSNRPALWLLRRLERRMYRAADRIVTVGRGYRDRIVERAPVADRISVVTNGVDLERFVPQGPDPRFLHQWELEGKFVCSYVGTIGMAHGLEVVLEAARILRARQRRDIAFCLVGDGAARRRLEDETRRDGLEPWVVFTGLQPKEEMPYVLASADACLVHLRKCELFGSVLPSKIFETMAMGRPIVLGVEGEARQVVLEAGAGLPMEPGDGQSLADVVQRMADRPDETARLGRQARRFVAERYDRDVLARRLLDLLESVAAGQPAPEAAPVAVAQVARAPQAADSLEPETAVHGAERR